MFDNETQESLGATCADAAGRTTVEVASVSGEIGYEKCEELETEGICCEIG
jgi:hypothetical protein